MTLLEVGDKIWSERYGHYSIDIITRVTDKMALVHIDNGSNNGKGYDIKFKREYEAGHNFYALGDRGKGFYRTSYKIVTPEIIVKINEERRINKLTNIIWKNVSSEKIKRIYDILKEEEGKN